MADTIRLGEIQADVGINKSGLKSDIGSIPGLFAGLGPSILAGAGLAAVTAAFVGIGKAGVTAASEIETGMAKISTLGNWDGSQLNSLKSDLLAISTQLPIASADLLEGAYQALSAGVDFEALTSTMLTAAQGSVGGFTDISTAVDGLTSVMNAYGPAVGSAQSVMDIFVQTQNLGKTTVDELAGSLGRVVPTAAALNIPFTQLSAALAAITAKGITTNEAVTGMKSVMTSVQKPSTEAQKLFSALNIEFSATALSAQGLGQFFSGIRGDLDQFAVTLNGLSGGSVQDFKTAFDQAGISTESLIKSTKDGKLSFTELGSKIKFMADNGADATSMLSLLLGSSESANAVIAMTSRSGADFAEKLLGISNASGSAETAAGKMTNTFSAQMTLLKNSFLPVLDGIGVELIKILLPAIKDIGNWINRHSNDIVGFFQDFMDFAGDTAKIITDYLWPAVEKVFDYIQDWFDDNSNDINGFFETFITYITKFINQLVDFAYPILTRIVTFLKNNYGPAIEFFKGIGENTIKVIDTILDLQVAIWKKLVPAFKDLFDFIDDNADVFWDFFGDLSDILDEVIDTVLDLQVAIWEELAPVFEDLFDFIDDNADVFWDFFGDLSDILMDVIYDVIGFVKQFDIQAMNLSGLFDSLFSAFNSVISIFQTFWDILYPVWQRTWDFISTIVSDLIDIFNIHLAPVVGKIGEIFENLWAIIANVAKLLAPILEFIYDLVLDTFEFLWIFLKPIIAGIAILIGGIVDVIAAALKGIKWFTDLFVNNEEVNKKINIDVEDGASGPLESVKTGVDNLDGAAVNIDTGDTESKITAISTGVNGIPDEKTTSFSTRKGPAFDTDINSLTTKINNIETDKKITATTDSAAIDSAAATFKSDVENNQDLTDAGDALKLPAEVDTSSATTSVTGLKTHIDTNIPDSVDLGVTADTSTATTSLDNLEIKSSGMKTRDVFGYKTDVDNTTATRQVNDLEKDANGLKTDGVFDYAPDVDTTNAETTLTNFETTAKTHGTKIGNNLGSNVATRANMLMPDLAQTIDAKSTVPPGVVSTKYDGLMANFSILGNELQDALYKKFESELSSQLDGFLNGDNFDFSEMGSALLSTVSGVFSDSLASFVTNKIKSWFTNNDVIGKISGLFTDSGYGLLTVGALAIASFWALFKSAKAKNDNTSAIDRIKDNLSTKLSEASQDFWDNFEDTGRVTLDNIFNPANEGEAEEEEKTGVVQAIIDALKSFGEETSSGISEVTATQDFADLLAIQRGWINDFWYNATIDDSLSAELVNKLLIQDLGLTFKNEDIAGMSHSEFTLSQQADELLEKALQNFMRETFEGTITTGFTDFMDRYAGQLGQVSGKDINTIKNELNKYIDPIKTLFFDDLNTFISTNLQSLKSMDSNDIQGTIKPLIEGLDTTIWQALASDPSNIFKDMNWSGLSAMFPGYAVGAWEVPKNMLANIHAKEMIIPPRESEIFRNMISKLDRFNNSNMASNYPQTYYNTDKKQNVYNFNFSGASFGNVKQSDISEMFKSAIASRCNL